MGLIYHAALENSLIIGLWILVRECATSGIFSVSRRGKIKSTIFKNRLVTTALDLLNIKRI